MSYREIEDPVPGDGQVLVAVDVAGVNYIDTYIREGIYPRPLPLIPGFEGTGTVIDDPSGTIAPGTLVAWCDGFGSYAEKVCVPSDRLVAVPQGIGPAVAASMLLQGMTAHYLTHGVCRLGPGDSCVITAGAGGVGLIATRMATNLGARVITVVSSDDKEQLSRQAGADVVLRYGDDLAAQIRDATDGQGVTVAYDGVGKDTFSQLLETVAPRGTLCLFGAASGPVDPVDPQLLNSHGSLFLTRPTLADYTASAEEFGKRAQAVTRAIVDGEIDIRIGATFPLERAADAHRALQSRATTGSVVLDVTGTLHQR